MTVGFHSRCLRRGPAWPITRPRCLRELRRHGRVEVAPARCDIASTTSATIGLHAEIYRRALARPGVVVLHDAVLHHFFLGHLGEAAYVEEFVYNYGEWNRGLARELWRGRAASGADERYFRYPMLKRRRGAIAAVIVHNPAAARTVREHAPDARIVEIPHLFAPPELPADARRAALPAAGGPGAGRVRVRRLRLPARIQARCSACSRPSPRCGGRFAAGGATDRRGVCFERPGAGRGAAAARGRA